MTLFMVENEENHPLKQKFFKKKAVVSKKKDIFVANYVNYKLK